MSVLNEVPPQHLALFCHEAMADNRLACSAKDTDHNLWRFIVMGMPHETRLDGTPQTLLNLMGSKDQILAYYAGELKVAHETYRGLMQRYEKHLPGCLTCSVAVEGLLAKVA